MRTSSAPPPRPLPSERLRIGHHVVDLSLREIAPADGDTPMRVTLKSIGVLTALIEDAGKLLTREALIERVWPNTLPTDDVLTQAVTQLRKALRDECERPHYIETVSKRGYRLIAPIEWLIETQADIVADRPSAIETSTRSDERIAQVPVISRDDAAQPAHADAEPPYEFDIGENAAAAALRIRAPFADASARPFGVASLGRMLQTQIAPRRTSWPQAPIVAVALLASLIVLFAANRQRAAREVVAAPSPIAVPMPFRPVPIRTIVSMPSRDTAPSLSPDGAQVAYAHFPKHPDAAGLMVQTTAAVTPRALTPTTTGRWDLLPSWSPDGKQIAFYRVEENADRERCRVMSIPAVGGVPRDLAECADYGFPLAWTPDGSALIGAGSVADIEGGSSGRALYRLDLDSGVWSRIPYARSPEDIDVWPRVSPDGRWIAFQRNLSLGDLWRVPIAGGEPERLTSLRANFFGLDWTPDGRGVVFSRAGPDGIVLSRLNIADGRIRDYVPEERMLKQPVVAGSTVAFVIEESRAGLRRVSVDGDDAYAKGEPLFASTRSEIMPSIAPDGRQLLFMSDRDGSARLWWVDQSRPDSLRPLDDIMPIPRFPPAWNADSTRALAIGEGQGGDAAAIYEIDPVRGRAVRLSVPDRVPVQAAYHPDPNRLLVVAEREQGRLGLVLYDRSHEPWRVVAEINDVLMALPDRTNDSVVFVRAYKPGVWRANSDLSGPREIDRVAMQARIRTLVAAADGPWLLDRRPNCRWFWRKLAAPSALSTPSAPDGRCLGDGPVMPEGLSYDSAHRRLYIGVAGESGRDIGVLPLSAFDTDAPVVARRD